MSKNFLEALGKLALFRNRESSLGEPATGSGVSLALDLGSGLGLERTIEDDRDQLRGVELATGLYHAGQTAGGTLSSKRAKPDFLSLVLAYFFGAGQTQQVAPGIYEHVFSPAAGLTPPSFTLLQRRGDSILKERFAGNLIEGFSLELGESWVGLSAEVTGIGKRETNYTHELLSASANSTSITLAANAVAGASAAERLENVFRVRAKDAGSQVWTVCKVTAVSAGAPATLTLEEPVGESSDPIDFHLDYLPTEPAWCEFPAELDESPLRLVDAQVMVDGYFNGSEVLGGEVISNELLSFSVSGKNSLELRKLADGSHDPWASEAVRGSRELSLKLSERLRHTVRQWQAEHPETEHLCVYLKLRGAEIEPGSGYYFGADLIFPRCGILGAPIMVKGKVLAQDGDLLVMDDGTYDGTFIRTWNRVNSYLA